MESDGPGNRAKRVLAAGIDIGPLVHAAAMQYDPMLQANGRLQHVRRLPRWQQVEIYLGMYERMRWCVNAPRHLGRVERALWYVQREMDVFHKNMFGGSQ